MIYWIISAILIAIVLYVIKNIILQEYIDGKLIREYPYTLPVKWLIVIIIVGISPIIRYVGFLDFMFNYFYSLNQNKNDMYFVKTHKINEESYLYKIYIFLKDILNKNIYE